MKLLFSSRLFLFVVSSTIAFVVGFILFDYDRCGQLVDLLGYWSILFTFAVFIGALLFILKEHWENALRPVWVKNKYIAALIFGIWFLLGPMQEHEHGIVYDEHVIQATALQMHMTQHASAVTRAYPFDGEFKPLVSRLDKRPLFFPFLVSAVHGVTGYRLENAFYLNNFLLLLTLFLAYHLGDKLAGMRGGLLSLLLWANVPILSLVSQGAGLELLNLCMMLFTALLGYVFWKAPSPATIIAFTYSGILLAQSRYESILFLASVAVIIIWRWVLMEKPLIPWLIVAAPFLLVCYVWQYRFAADAPGVYQWREGESMFALQYFWDNLVHAYIYFLNLKPDMPSAGIIFLIGALGGGVALFRHKLAGIKASWIRSPVSCVYFLNLSGLGVLLLCCTWGDFDSPTHFRYTLPFYCLFIFPAMWAINELQVQRKIGIMLFSLLTLHFVFATLPLLQKREMDYYSFPARVENWKSDWLEQYEGTNTLFIDWDSSLYLLHELPCVKISSLKKRMPFLKYHFEKDTFDEVIIFERTVHDLKGRERLRVPYDQIPDIFTTEQIIEASVKPLSLVRFSRVTAIDFPEMTAEGIFGDTLANPAGVDLDVLMRAWELSLP